MPRQVLYPLVVAPIPYISVSLLGLLFTHSTAMLEQRGVKAAAIVVDSSDQGRRIDFEFTVHGQTINTDGFVDRSTADELYAGGTISIIYDPMKPHRAILASSLPHDGGHPNRAFFDAVFQTPSLQLILRFVAIILMFARLGAIVDRKHADLARAAMRPVRLETSPTDHDVHA